MSVLITAGSHSAAYKLERLINESEVIFADHLELPQLTFSGRKFVKIPAGNSASFAHQVLDLALNEGVKKIFPLHADEIIPFAESRQLFLEYGISVIVPSKSWFERNPLLKSNSKTELIVVEMGKLIAGELPQGVTLTDDELSGVFWVGMENGNQTFELFTV